MMANTVERFRAEQSISYLTGQEPIDHRSEDVCSWRWNSWIVELRENQALEKLSESTIIRNEIKQTKRRDPVESYRARGCSQGPWRPAYTFLSLWALDCACLRCLVRECHSWGNQREASPWKCPLKTSELCSAVKLSINDSRGVLFSL